MYGSHAYGALPYAGGPAAPTTPVVPAHDALDGIWLEGTALVEVSLPVAALPVGLVRGQRVDKALAYPTPVLVGGRPT